MSSSPRSIAALSDRLKSDLILLLVAVVWGSGFIAQRLVAGHLGVFVFNGLRFLLAALVLLPFTRLHLHIEKEHLPAVGAAGVLLFIASALQQAGIRTTTVANAGFITGLYVVLVPLLLALVWKHSVRPVTWAAAGIAVVGLYLLSMQGALRLSPGDGLELIGAFFWALHVILVGWLARRGEALSVSIGQFVVAGLLNLVVGIAFEGSTFAALSQTWPAVLYSSVLVIALGFTLQIVGQKHAPAADAAIVLSMETVFAALFGWLILRESFTPLQLLGCGLILAAIMLAQLTPNPAKI